MEKLSDKNPCNTCTVDRQVGNPYSWQSECDRCIKPSKWKDECVKKLKAYEDLGQRCIEETHFGLEMLPDKWLEFYGDIEQFYEWQKLKEQGRLMELPCKVGDTVYWINKEAKQPIIPLRVMNFKIISNDLAEGFKVDCVGKWDDGYVFRKTCVGKDILLTREEAEEALKKMSEMEGE